MKSSVVVLALAFLAAIRVDAGQDDAVARARGLALAGQRPEAIVLLQESVAASPGNSDAIVLLGTVFSWEGRFDEARQQLEPILARDPLHGDALPALINVELWSDHPDRAEALASRALRNRPNDTLMLLARARALSALLRQTEARETLDRLLVIDPRHVEARQLRRGVRASLRLWQVRAGSSYDGFSGRPAWRETQVSVGRDTPIGSVSLKATRADRFGLQDGQIEIEAYPRFRPGTYAYVAGAYSRDEILFPGYRYAADIYQSVGAGFEASAGFRRLGFGSGVNIYVASLSKYYGNWLFSGRTYVTPRSAGTSRSYHGSFRRYFGDTGAYVGARYGRGGPREVRNLNDFEVLDSDVTAGEATVVIRRRFELNGSASYGRGDRAGRRDVRQYSIGTGLGFRF